MIDRPPRGLVADLVTPFDKRGRPDGKVIELLMRRIEDEVAGFLIGGLEVGETWPLGPEARVDILTAALDVGRRDLAVVFDVTAAGKKETADLIARADGAAESSGRKTGIYYLFAPLVYHSNRDLPRHFRDLGQRSSRSFILANDPGLVGRLRPGPHHKNIRTSVLKKMGGIDQLAGLAFDGDLSRALNYQRALKQKRAFRLYDRNEAHFIERPSSSGLISIGANVLPAAWADIVGTSLNLCDAQRLYPDHLSQIWQSGRAVRALIDLYRDKPAAVIKTALYLMDVIPRPDGPDDAAALTDEETAGVREFLTRLHLV